MGTQLFKSLLIIMAFAFGAQQAAANDKVKVFVDLSKSGLTDAQNTTFLNGLKAKFNFEVDGANVAGKMDFTTTKPSEGKFHTVTIDNKLVASDYGENSGTKSTVYRKKLTNGHWRNIFNTPEKQMASMIDTGAHELAHQFLPGHGHNWHAKDEATETTDVDGTKYVRTRDVGGNKGDVNGKPGLMARGSKVTAAESAQGGRDFTDEEKKTLKNAITELAGGKNLTPKPGGADKPADKQTDLKFIKGITFDPEDPSPGFVEPFQLDEIDDLLDIRTVLQGNSIWEFGYTTMDDEFFPLLDAGVDEGMLSFEPGAIFDFAIHESGLSDDIFFKMSDVGLVTILSQPIDPSFSVSPTISDEYFRSVQFGFDVDGFPDTLEVNVEMSVFHDDLDAFDGIVPMSVPEPSTFLLFASAAAAFAVWQCRKQGTGSGLTFDIPAR